MTFSKFDLKFLKSVGIRADDTPPDDERLALAKRIAINQAPTQVKVSPSTARLAATDSHDPTLEFLKANDLPLTRENYLTVAYMGNPPKNLDAEAEAALPADFEDCE